MKITKEQFPNFFIRNFSDVKDIHQLKKSHCYPPAGYLWMICQNSFCNYYIGNEAKKTFDSLDKNGAISIQFDGMYSENETHPLSDFLDSSYKIDKAKLIEFYVIDCNLKWCYIVTHEGDNCGPFLIFKN